VAGNFRIVRRLAHAHDLGRAQLQQSFERPGMGSDRPKFSTINATIEKLTEAATWRGPWSRRQRCILPAIGFYEWQVQADGRSKQPYYITANDQAIFGFAGLWDRSKREDGTKVESCTIVTMSFATKLSGNGGNLHLLSMSGLIIGNSFPRTSLLAHATQKIGCIRI